MSMKSHQELFPSTYRRTRTPKQRVRKKIRILRDSLSPSRQEQDSLAIARHLLCEIQKFDLRTVMIYCSFGSEVITVPLRDQLLRAGHRVVAPVTFPGRRMEAYRITDPKRDLIPGEFGIVTPDPTHCEHCPPEQIGCVIVPGIAFDPDGWRIGYGAGYYDRFLARCPQAHTIGAAFGIQMIDHSFPDDWDRPVHQVATETRVIDCHPDCNRLKSATSTSDNTHK